MMAAIAVFAVIAPVTAPALDAPAKAKRPAIAPTPPGRPASLGGGTPKGGAPTPAAAPSGPAQPASTAPPAADAAPPVPAVVDGPRPLPAASRQRMHACGAEWQNMKMTGQAVDKTWREFAEICLSR
jgi:hypothetical protein